VLAYAATVFFSGFALFLLGLSVFMYHENRKFGDNQFTVKLLPPPPLKASTPVEGHARTFIGGVPGFIRSELPVVGLGARAFSASVSPARPA
jgi:hypothetical protein